MDLAAAITAAHSYIVGYPAPAGRLDVNIFGRADGTLGIETPVHGAPDVTVEYCGDSYVLTAFGEVVEGALHTLSRVLYTRLARQAALIPANR